MDAAVAISAHAVATASALAEHTPARPSLDRQIAMLEALSDLCMQVAQATSQRVLATVGVADAAPPSNTDGNTTPTPPALPGDPALAFTRAARSVRMSVGLWSQLTREKQAQEEAAARGAVEDRRVQTTERRARAERMVGRIAEDHFEAVLPGEDNDFEAMEAIGRVTREARERLGDEDLYGDLADAPFSEIVARVCADIGVSPDWPRLAGEYWAQAEIAQAAQAGAVGAPLAAFARAGGAGEAAPPAADPPGEAGGEGALAARWRRRREARGDGPPPTTIRVHFVDPAERAAQTAGLGPTFGAPMASPSPP